MSRFLSASHAGLIPYVPGEQPRDRSYIKLNTNESPFPPSPRVLGALNEAETARLNLYSDPTAAALNAAIAARYGVASDRVFSGNGSDEVLAFAFTAYGEGGITAPDISYGFYPIFAEFFGIPYHTLPLTDDLHIRAEDFIGASGTVVLANPNAQTGEYLTLTEIESITASRPDRIVIVDEAYIDFGGESAVTLTARYDNLLVVQTFSKSRNLAGARIGFAIGNAALIADLNTLRNSFNPYNINRLSMVAGVAAMEDEEYFQTCTREIRRVRELTRARLTAMGFRVTTSLANFLLASTPAVGGRELYLALKERGILVRYLGDKRIENCVRITIGTEEQMETLLSAIETIIREDTKCVLQQ